MEDLVEGHDGVTRCGWCASDPLYVRYHDQEWGVPVHDDVRLFEKICLEGFQSGLSWLTILRKRGAFREVFAGFNPQTVAGFDEEDVERLLEDPRIIRHRGKIEATVLNARRYLELRDEGTTLDELAWSFAPDEPREPPRSLEDLPAETPQSRALSGELRRRRWRYIGSTTAYAFMQAMGLVNDHLVGCFRRAELDGSHRAAIP